MSNNILVITSNPEKDSMTDAVGAAFAAGAVERGASADVLDLYDEGFNPVYSAADRAHFLRLYESFRSRQAESREIEKVMKLSGVGDLLKALAGKMQGGN